MFRQSLRMTRRDWRAGELRFLLIALIVAVAALSLVGFFVDLMRGGLKRDAAQLLGVDLVLSADQLIPADWRTQAEAHGLKTAETAVFSSIAMAGEGDSAHSLLSAIKAVLPTYPLRGQLKLSTRDDGNEAPAVSGITAPGTVWVDPAILSSLDLHVGDPLKLGDKRFTIAQALSFDTDRGSPFINFSLRDMLGIVDLLQTNLI